MKGNSVYKVPGGKLLKISLEAEGNKIKSVKITGDFFMHPETGVELIEEAIAGKEINDKLADTIEKTMKKNPIKNVGKKRYQMLGLKSTMIK